MECLGSPTRATQRRCRGVRPVRPCFTINWGGCGDMIDYRILGPLEVSADGRVIEVGGPKLRALLIILLLRANESVPRDVLVHELWGEQPPADLANGRGPQVEAVRLEELRLSAIEDRIDSDLALARHADVVGELEALVALHPLRERLHGQLMIALYRCGRQADALAAYREARRTLIEELGLEPGPALQRLECAILQQDASLDLPGQAAPASARDRATETRPPSPLG